MSAKSINGKFCREYAFEDLCRMETLYVGHHADLKVESETERQWLIRAGDGLYESEVLVERYGIPPGDNACETCGHDPDSAETTPRWHTAGSYTAIYRDID